jgi:hypothetical protein
MALMALAAVMMVLLMIFLIKAIHVILVTLLLNTTLILTKQYANYLIMTGQPLQTMTLITHSPWMKLKDILTVLLLTQICQMFGLMSVQGLTAITRYLIFQAQSHRAGWRA